MASLLTYPVVPTEDGINQYFNQVWQFPVLEKEQEQMLAIRFRERGDTLAAHKLVTSHLRLVVKIAMKYKGYGLPLADLVSEGNIGLMRAVKKFDPDKGFRLSTYAMWWIRASITEFVLKSWSLVRMGTVASQKKLFFSLRRMKSRLNILDSGDLSDGQVKVLSDKLDATPEQIVYMNQRMAGRDFSLNTPMSNDQDGSEFQDMLVDDTPSQEQVLVKSNENKRNADMLKDIISDLPDREKYIFMQRRLTDNPPTLEELGKKFGVSRERVRQLEARAFTKVQKAIVEQVKFDSCS